MTEKKSLFSRLREGLFKSREQMSAVMEATVTEHRAIDEDYYEDLMDALILSDMGNACATDAITRLRAEVKERKLKDAAEAKAALKEILAGMLEVEKPVLHWPMVVLMVGVNGVGKTTTIGKLALRFQGLGRTI
ncbi:MAG: signal recognition particle receptor subunit alpha, partial [Clostridia bacterium]